MERRLPVPVRDGEWRGKGTFIAKKEGKGGKSEQKAKDGGREGRVAHSVNVSFFKRKVNLEEL